MVAGNNGASFLSSFGSGSSHNDIAQAGWIKIMIFIKKIKKIGFI